MSELVYTLAQFLFVVVLSGVPWYVNRTCEMNWARIRREQVNELVKKEYKLGVSLGVMPWVAIVVYFLICYIGINQLGMTNDDLVGFALTFFLGSGIGIVGSIIWLVHHNFALYFKNRIKDFLFPIFLGFVNGSLLLGVIGFGIPDLQLLAKCVLIVTLVSIDILGFPYLWQRGNAAKRVLFVLANLAVLAGIAKVWGLF